MKSLKWRGLGLAATIIVAGATCAYSYPPNNAAVLYYKAAAYGPFRHDASNEMATILSDLPRGKIKANARIRGFLKKNRQVIKAVLDATEAPECDWGIDFSQGVAMDVGPLEELKNLARLVAAEAMVLAADGDHKAAMERCMSLYKMADHINDRTYVSYLTSAAVSTLASEGLMAILPYAEQDTASLKWLKTELREIKNAPLSPKPALAGEGEMTLRAMTRAKIGDLARARGWDAGTTKKVRSLGEGAMERNREHFRRHMGRIIEAFDMPYAQGYDAVKKVEKKIRKDVEGSPKLMVVPLVLLDPGPEVLLTTATRLKTDNNAIRAGIQLYLIRARRGKLPEKLPADLPRDLFSGKDFEYEKRAAGFVLRCRGKDMVKNEMHAYEFAVKRR